MVRSSKCIIGLTEEELQTNQFYTNWAKWAKVHFYLTKQLLESVIETTDQWYFHPF